MNVPKHLSKESRKVFRRISSEYELTADGAMILQASLEAWDRAQCARRLVNREGLVIEGKRHPATDIEKQSYSLFLRGMRQLGLDVLPPGPAGRPPEVHFS